jgi:hypothetical protein
MQIKGPTAPPAVGTEAPSVRPAVAGNTTPPASAPPVAANTVQLSPALFQIGQLLEAVVTKIDGNMLILTLQNPILDEHGQRINLQLTAPASKFVQPGQQLTVQVKNIQNGIPQLQVVAAQNEALNLASVLHNAQQQQRPLPPLYANLAELQQLQSKQQFDSLPTLVRERIQSLWRSLPDAVQLQKPAGMKQAMNYSGPFLEAALMNMAQGQTRGYPALDVQSGLLRLASAIRTQLESAALTREATQASTRSSSAQSTLNRSAENLLALTTSNTDTLKTTLQTTAASAKPATPMATPNEVKPFHPQIPDAQARATAFTTGVTTEHLLEQLLQQTEAGLARILTQQLHTASHDPQRPVWLLELPVRQGDGVDVFDLRIQRDAEDKEADAKRAQHTWTVMLAFDLQGLGPVRAQVSLVQDQISTFWWADQADTVELFHQHLDHLQHRISAAGLKVNKLHCQQGIPDTEQTPRTLPISNVIVDEQI